MVGIIACSTAVIFIKLSNENSVLLSAYRLLVAAIALTPVYLRDLRRHEGRYSMTDLRASIVPGIALGLHFISWIIGVRLTTATNASLIVNLTPIVMPFFMYFMIREKITTAEIAGTIVSLAGLALLSGADFNLSRDYFWGDVLCLVSMLVMTWYMALGRRNRQIASTWLYVVPLYYVAGIFCFLVSLFFVNPVKPYSLREILLILALGLIPTVAGHSILNYSLKYLRGQIVSILNMSQFIFAGIMAYAFLNEIPAWNFYVASVILVAGCILAIRGQETSS